jgi:anti-sigma28 factor (negative regulator of flagellin synthesis)
MSSIIDIHGVAAVNAPSTQPSQPIAQPRIDDPAETKGDVVEFSPLARRLSALVDGSSLRAAKVNALRAAIQSGAYETRERIDGTVARLLGVLGRR